MDVQAFIQKHKPLLDIFAGSHAHDTTDGVWRDLLSFSAPLTRLPPVDLQICVAPFCEQLGMPVCLSSSLLSFSFWGLLQPAMHDILHRKVRLQHGQLHSAFRLFASIARSKPACILCYVKRCLQDCSNVL